MSGIRHEYVQANGLRFHCAVAGDGPLVLLLHGFPQTWYSWRRQLSFLEAHYKVVAPDLRGYGDTEKPRNVGDYALSNLVEDVAGLIAAFGRKRAIVVGHDWGGAVAWATALQRPDLVERLVVMNCPHPVLFLRALKGNPRQMLRSWYMAFFQIPGLAERLLSLGRGAALGALFRWSAAERGAFSDEDLGVYRAAWLKPGAAKAAVDYYRAAWRGRLLMEKAAVSAPRISAPTLVLWGERDTALGVELTEGMDSLIEGGVRLVRIPEASHWVQEERPDRVNQELLRFLTSAPGSGL